MITFEFEVFNRDECDCCSNIVVDAKDIDKTIVFTLKNTSIEAQRKHKHLEKLVLAHVFSVYEINDPCDCLCKDFIKDNKAVEVKGKI